MSDHKTRAQLADENAALIRERDADRQHRAAIKRDLARAEALQHATILYIDSRLGGPVIRDLLWVLSDIVEATDPTQAANTENTMRVTNPSSTRDEGAPTRRYRKLQTTARYRIERVTDTLRNDLERDVDSETLTEIRRRSAFIRWHNAGKHTTPTPGCPQCT